METPLLKESVGNSLFDLWGSSANRNLRALFHGFVWHLIAEAHYPTLLRPRSEGREFSLLATAFDPQLLAEWRRGWFVQRVLVKSGTFKIA